MDELKQPWTTEPNEKKWRTEAGFPAFIKRHPQLLHLCGYIGVPSEHPWYAVEYDAISPYPDVHGGLTYSEYTAPTSKPDGLWWVGFDCAHLGDLSPGMSYQYFDNARYRDMGFVIAECESLAAQAAAQRAGKEQS